VVLERLEALRRSNFCNMSASVPKTYYLFLLHTVLFNLPATSRTDS
jgi:hypothetical protein